MSDKTCVTCDFFYQYQFNQTSGVCRRYPPQVFNASDSRFPAIPSSLWCGEFKDADPVRVRKQR